MPPFYHAFSPFVPERKARAALPAQPRIRTIRVEPTILHQLYAFQAALSQVVEGGRITAWTSMLKFAHATPTEFDEAVLMHLEAGQFAVSHALFSIQNVRNMSRLHLYHILQNKNATKHFLRLVGLSHVGAKARKKIVLAQEATEWVRELMWFSSPTLDVTSDQPGMDIQYDPTHPPLPTMPFVQRCLQDAVSAELNQAQYEDLRDTILEAVGAPEDDTLYDKKHSRTQVLYAMALVYRMKHTRMSKTELVVVQRELERVLAWIHAFLKDGCDCAV